MDRIRPALLWLAGFFNLHLTFPSSSLSIDRQAMKDCNQCGKCCQIYGDGGLSATAEDIAWWDDHRPAISRYERAGQIWMDPATGAQLPACPWLEKLSGEEKYTCAIYFDRPDDCRQYPVLVSDMIKDGCEMIEAIDLQDTQKAQSRLDLLMSESR